MSALTPLVQKFDPLLESLIGGRDIHRAAAWGQVPQEAGPECSPAAVSADGGHGLWQHTGSRWDDLQAFANALGKSWKDTETQVRFVGSEINGPEAHAWAQTRKTTTVEAATETFMLDFERPAVQGGPPTYGTARLDVRVRGAKEALAVIQAAHAGEKKVTDTSSTVKPVATAQELAERLANIETMLEQQADVLADFAGFGTIKPILHVAEAIVNPLLTPLNQKLGSDLQANQVANAIISALVLAGKWLSSRNVPAISSPSTPQA